MCKLFVQLIVGLAGRMQGSVIVKLVEKIKVLIIQYQQNISPIQYINIKV